MKLIKPDIRKIFLIIIISSSLGIFYNFFSKSGIPLVKSPVNIEWADDSSFVNITDTNKVGKIASPANRVSQTVKEEEKAKENEDKKKNEEVIPPKAITLLQAFKLYKTKNAIFIDARDKWEYSDGHIKGAVNIAEYSFDRNTSKAKSLDKSRILITYCGEGDCSMSEKLAEKLFQMGFQKVYIFKEGFESWLKAGYETERTELE